MIKSSTPQKASRVFTKSDLEMPFTDFCSKHFSVNQFPHAELSGAAGTGVRSQHSTKGVGATKLSGSKAQRGKVRSQGGGGRSGRRFVQPRSLPAVGYGNQRG